MPSKKLPALALLAAIFVVGQTFEVASIKPSAPGQPGTSFNAPSHGRHIVSNATLRALVLHAWSLRDYQLTGGPKWLDSVHYDITAATQNEPDSQQLRAMERALLTERFKLVVHPETKDGPLYFLVAAKSGSKLQAAAADAPGGLASGPKMMQGKGASTVQIAEMLSNQTSRKVVDKTELTRLFDFKLEWTPDMTSANNAPDTTGPSFFTALQEQLGLRLEPGKGPIEILVIDHAEPPTEN